MMYRKAFLSIFITVFPLLIFAQSIEGLWWNEESTAKVKIYKAKNEKYYGKIEWLKEPLKDGKPRVDEHNPKEAKRSDPLLGLIVLKGFIKDSKEKYEDGTIYDPKNGKTYSCHMHLKGNKLEVRGYVGISLIGRTATWTRVD